MTDLFQDLIYLENLLFDLWMQILYYLNRHRTRSSISYWCVRRCNINLGSHTIAGIATFREQDTSIAIVFTAREREKILLNSSQVVSATSNLCIIRICTAKLNNGELIQNALFPFLLPFFVSQCINNINRNYCEFCFVFARFNTASEVATRNCIAQSRNDRYLYIHFYIRILRVSNMSKIS